MTRQHTVPAQLDAIRLSDAVRRRLVEFSLDAAFTSDEQLRRICRRLWSGEGEQGGLVTDLWIEGSFPSSPSTVTLRDLTAEGVFDERLRDLLSDSGAFPADRPLYEHQEESLRCASAAGEAGRPAIVVSAGTGAGKTECFLLPMLNDLYRRPRSGKGIQCLMLYPMNALVNDQVDRLYQWLCNQEEVTLFHFTSETPESKRHADRLGIPQWEPCRFRTRQEARGREARPGTKRTAPHPPDILITNYSMLEYMLCRPQDSVFFGSALRTVVLDEAHLYTGTLAAEITLLLRRLYARCGVDPSQLLQIATSATLGGAGMEEYRSFTATIFSKEPEQVSVIVGRQARAPLREERAPAEPVTVQRMNEVRWLDAPLLVADTAGNVRLEDAAPYADRLRRDLARLTSAEATPGETRPAVVLHQVLRHAPIVAHLEAILWREKRLPLHALAEQLWGANDAEAKRATMTLLTLAAGARTDPREFPLIPHRIHLVVRPSQGLSVCLNRECTAEREWRFSGLGGVVAGVADRCTWCRSAMLALVRCDGCGEPILAGRLEGARYVNQGMEWHDATFFQVAAPGSGSAGSEVTVLRPADGEVIGAGGGGIVLRRVVACPACGAGAESFRSFATSDSLTSSIVAETVLSELPEYPASHHPFLPARGRRLLAFSDSRREAARLGPRLRIQHEARIIRAAIYHCLAEHTVVDDDVVHYFEQRLEELERLRHATSSEPVRRQLDAEYASVRQSLDTAQAGGSVAHWAEQLAGVPWLAELLDVESAGQHQVLYRRRDGSTRPWSQTEWERNADAIRAQTLLLLARELMVPNPRAMSLETLGMAEITYPGIEHFRLPDAVLGQLPTGVGAHLETCWTDLLRFLCDTLRMDGCVTVGGGRETDLAYGLAAVPIGQWMAERQRGWYLHEWVGRTQRGRRHRFVRAVLVACGCSPESSDALVSTILAQAFRQLVSSASSPETGDAPVKWLRIAQRQCDGGGQVTAMQIDFSQLGIRLPRTLYRCRRTGRLWPRSVARCAPEIGCEETLVPTSPAELEHDPRVGRLRREYRDSPVFRLGLWSEEHSAQLDPKENRRLQDLFRAGLRNLLSATTTLELGIDIGGLAAVYMGNVPPGKANYLQRAGRAGRRSDGSAAVVTYARVRPYDQEVFRRFGDYLDRPLRRPTIFLDRERLPRRHFHAWLLGRFFLERTTPDDRPGAMEAFGKMGAFCGTPLAMFWRKGEPAPAPMCDDGSDPSEAAMFADYMNLLSRDAGGAEVELARRLFRQTPLVDALHDWPRLIEETIDRFDQAVADWRADYDRLYQLWRNAVASDQRAQTNALAYQLRTLSDVTVIEALADRQFLPRYGFPIGLHRLKVLVPEAREEDGRRQLYARTEDQFRLERAGILSLAEYVPGSQLIVGGRQITSHGLLKHWSGEEIDESPGLRGSLCRCVNNHVYYGIGEVPEECPICGGRLRRKPESLLFIKYGFTTAAWDPPKWSTKTNFVGAPETLTITFRQRDAGEIVVRRPFADIGGLAALYREDGELLVYHRGRHDFGFAICLKCGYAESERWGDGSGRLKLPARFAQHAPLRSPRESTCCWASQEAPPVLRHQILAARTTTDVLMLDLSECLGPAAGDRPTMWALAYALQRSATERLELDSRELGVLLVPSGPRGTALGVVLYDNVPGGAGHVRELMEEGRAWLESARDVLFVNRHHDQVCESGCLDCLLSFEAQRMMARETFDRRAALRSLDRLLSASRTPVEPADHRPQTE